MIYLECSSNYRNCRYNAVNKMYYLTLQVKIELNTQGKTMAFIEFDGRGSNYLNWFHNTRIIKTSWTDIQKSGSYYFFSIDK